MRLCASFVVAATKGREVSVIYLLHAHAVVPRTAHPAQGQVVELSMAK